MRGRQRAIDRRVLPAQQRLAEAAQAQEIEVLLARQRRQRRQQRARFRREPRRAHRVHVRFAEEGQAESRGVRDERMEEHGLVQRGEVVVEQRAVRPLGQRAELCPQRVVALVGRARSRRDQARELPRRVHARARIGDAVDGMMQHVPRGAAHLRARQRVVADEHHAVRRQPRAREREKAVAHRGRDPRVHAVGDHVVEVAVRGIERREVLLDQHNVAQPERRDRRAPGGERARRQVAADEGRLRESHRHRDQVRAVVASHFQHAAALDLRRREAEERRDGGEAVRVRARMRLRRVRDRVVARGELRVGAVGARAALSGRDHGSRAAVSTSMYCHHWDRIGCGTYVLIHLCRTLSSSRWYVIRNGA